MLSKTFIVSDIGEITAIKRKGQKSIRLKIKQRKISVTQPTWLPFEASKAFVISKKQWILEQLNTQEAGSTVTYKQGQAIGKYHTLVLLSGDRLSSRVSTEHVRVTLPHGSTPEDNAEYISKSVIKALRQESESYLPQRTAELSEKTGLKYKSVSVKSLKRRWGSCSSKKDITFNIYLMSLSYEHIDYVILHELCHTAHLNHGDKFWALMEHVCPSAKQIAKKVRKLQPA